MTSIPEIGTKIWANVVRPGMIVRASDGTRVEVERIVEGYDTFTYDNGYGRSAKVEYGALIEVLGYFNPEV
jgi:hypothetical protein